MIRLILMRTHLVDGCVKLVEEEGEGLLALQRRPGEQVAVAQAEFHLEKEVIITPGKVKGCLRVDSTCYKLKHKTKNIHVPQCKFYLPLPSQ